MNISAKYLDKIKEKYNLENQNQIANFLEVNRSNISLYYSGKRNFDLYTCAKVADLLDIDFENIAIELGREMAKNPKEREFWAKKAELISWGVAYGVAILLLNFNSLIDCILC